MTMPKNLEIDQGAKNAWSSRVLYNKRPGGRTSGGKADHGSEVSLSEDPNRLSLGNCFLSLEVF